MLQCESFQVLKVFFSKTTIDFPDRQKVALLLLEDTLYRLVQILEGNLQSSTYQATYGSFSTVFHAHQYKKRWRSFHTGWMVVQYSGTMQEWQTNGWIQQSKQFEQL